MQSALGRRRDARVDDLIHASGAEFPNGRVFVAHAEAEVPYDQMFEMEDINAEFGQADVAIILRADDVVNPAAHTKGSPLDAMPILKLAAPPEALKKHPPACPKFRWDEAT